MGLLPKSEGWRPRQILVYHLVAALLGATMLWGPTAELWQVVSTEVFFVLNGSLLWHQYWAVFWAFMNTKAYDIIGAVLMVLPSLFYVYRGRNEDLQERLSRASVAWVGVVIMVIISKRLLPAVDFYSPSLVLEPTILINDLVPWIEAKWESKKSFPGDHAVAGFAFCSICFLLIDRKYAWMATFFGIAYSLPRLISGGHWLSDELVGGGMALMITLGWVRHMPALKWSRAIWQRMFAWHQNKFSK